MMRELEIEKPEALLDLGGGRGSLLAAARLRWRDIALSAVDIDQENVDYINHTFTNVSVAKLDVISRDFEENLREILKRSIGDFDLLVGNPPYIKLKWEKHFLEILDSAKLLGTVEGFESIDASIIFLSRYLSNKSAKSHIALIVPDSIASSRKYSKLRKVLVDEHGLYKVVNLPRGIFKGTDVKTHMLYFSNRIINSGLLEICKIENNFTTKRIKVDPEYLPSRLDYDFISHEESFKIGYRLGDICSVSRGNINYSHAKSVGREIFHTSSFSEKEKYVDSEYSDLSVKEKRGRASPGDILVGRVGRNILDQKLILRSGYLLVSDCIIIIRPSDKALSEIIFSEMVSERGRSWLASRIKGTGAKIISISDIRDFPL